MSQQTVKLNATTNQMEALCISQHHMARAEIEGV